MAKHMIGVYETPGETLVAIEELEASGYHSENILVIANRNDVFFLQERSGTNVMKPENDSGASSESFWEKAFSLDGNNESESHTLKSHFSESEMAQYNEALTRGKIILLAANNKENEMGKTRALAHERQGEIM